MLPSKLTSGISTRMLSLFIVGVWNSWMLAMILWGGICDVLVFCYRATVIMTFFMTLVSTMFFVKSSHQCYCCYFGVISIHISLSLVISIWPSCT